MINQIGGFEEIVETGKSTVQNVQKSAAQGAKNFANAAVGQIAGNQSSTPQNDPGANEAANASSQKQVSDDQAKQFLQDLYGKSDQGTSENSNPQKDPAKQDPQNNSNPQNPLAQAIGLAPKNPNEDKSPEEMAKMEALRQQLHGRYYDSLTNQEKPPDESVTDKLEREDEEEKEELWEKDKEKPPPLSSTQKTGTGERGVGVSG